MCVCVRVCKTTRLTVQQSSELAVVAWTWEGRKRSDVGDCRMPCCRATGNRDSSEKQKAFRRQRDIISFLEYVLGTREG